MKLENKNAQRQQSFRSEANADPIKIGDTPLPHPPPRVASFPRRPIPTRGSDLDLDLVWIENIPANLPKSMHQIV